MNEGRTVFAQLMDALPKYEFDKCVHRYRGNFRVRSLPAYEQFLVMAFAQLTFRESLRDIETCLRALGPKLYHSGIAPPTARSTLADANEKRDWRLFADFAHVLIQQTSTLYAGEAFGAELEQAASALDSTTVDLCLSLFPWAKFPRRKAAIKLHTLLALRGNYPTVVIITPGSVHEHPRPTGLRSRLVLHRRSRLSGLRSPASSASERCVLCHARQEKLPSHSPLFASRGQDHRVALRSDCGAEGLLRPARLSRCLASHWLSASGKALVFLSNSFTQPALTIAHLYHCRWQIELFFKWIKQHLRIKAFYGTTENAVRTQIWIAIAVYLLVALLKKRLHLSSSLYTILQILSLTLFEKTPILQALSSQPMTAELLDTRNQPCLPGFLTGQ